MTMMSVSHWLFCTTLLCFAFFKYFYLFYFVCVRVGVGVCMIN